MTALDLPASALVEAIDDPVLVVDDGTVVATNDAAERLLGPGDSLDAALADRPALESQVRRREDGVVSVETDDGTAYYDCSVSAVEADGRTFDFVVLHDVTARQRERQALARENERLDEFATVISHDLRNPLDVAIGRTTAADELTDDPQVEAHLDEIRDSHERMRRIIQDVLTLARGGDQIDDTSALDLAGVAERAWSHVETDGATVELRTDASVVADRERLERLFENLFRNAVEHGSTSNQPAADDAAERGVSGDAESLTVTVGDLSGGDGFYVADDGDGIDPGRREDVLEAGVSADAGGTGLGLAIVSTIADGHGWAVTVTESAAGGARFEFSGVETADE